MAINIINCGVEKLDRNDSKFLALYQEHKEVVEELVSLFTVEELVNLISKVPFEKEVAIIIVGRVFGMPRTESKLLGCLAKRTNRPYDLAAYIACASQNASNKLLLHIETLQLEVKRLTSSLLGLVMLVEGKKAVKLNAYIKGNEK